MPAGLPYFAWVDANETTFEAGHMRWDESIFSFTCQQSEGDPASLTVVVRRPRNEAGDPIGLLGPGRKIWAWFAFDCGTALFKFFGRLVGIPTSILEDLVTLEFIARPVDLVAQKEALAATLRVLPYYDEVVLDEARRSDPDVVLEGYTKVWHYDRETHILTVSDEITGEDGLVEFDGESEDGKVLYDGLGLTLTSGPLAQVDVTAEFSWTQQARGTVDLTKYLVSQWPNEVSYGPRIITSFTLTSDDWPKSGAGIGEGWTVGESTARAVYSLNTSTVTENNKIVLNWSEGGSTSIQHSSSATVLQEPPGSIFYGGRPANWHTSVSYSDDGDGNRYASSYSSSLTIVSGVLPLHHTEPTLMAAYTAARPCIELVSISLVADVQSVLTDPEDGEVMRIDDVRSVNLSEAIDGDVPIGDPRRRSYIATARGNQSIEHLIVLARAHLMKRARVVEIAFAPKLSRMPDITLRKNVFLLEPRIGEAVGKVTFYSLALDGADGRIKCEVRIGCAIGRGGSAVAAGGEPTYCSIDYAGADYQQFTGRTVLFDSSVGYQPPSAAPNDDGIEFLSVITAPDVIDTGLVVENPPATQRSALIGGVSVWEGKGMQVQPPDPEMLEARKKGVDNVLKLYSTRASFKLKSMNRQFKTDYDVQVTDVKIPSGYDLEAV